MQERDLEAENRQVERELADKYNAGELTEVVPEKRQRMDEDDIPSSTPSQRPKRRLDISKPLSAVAVVSLLFF